MTQSKEYPEIQKLQNRTLIPYNIQQKQQTDEDGETTNYYEYDLIRKPLDFQETLENIRNIILIELKSENNQYI